MTSISSRDKAIAAENNILSEAFDSATQQTVSIIDIISEGPIEGLVNGQASIFLNDDRVTSFGQTSLPVKANYTLTISSGSAVATLNEELPISESLSGNRYFTVEGVFTNDTATIQDSDLFNGNTIFTVNTSGSFFEDYMLGNNYAVGAVKARLVSSGYPTIHGSFITKTSATEAEFNCINPGSVRDVIYTIYIDFPLPVTSFSGTTVQLPAVAWFSGTFNLRAEGAQEDTVYTDVSDNAKYNDVTTQFRVGNLHQPLLSQHNGLGNTSISNASFSTSALEQSTVFGGDGATIELIGTSSSGFNLSASQAKQVDEVRLIIAYPGGLFSTSGNTGSTYESYAFYKYELQINRGGVWGDIVTIEENRRHKGSGESKSAFTIEEVFNLEPFAPFDDFKIIINRRSRHDGESVTSSGGDAGSKYTQVASAVLASVTSVIKELLWYPYTAYAAVTFSSKEFQSVPSRTYHCRGLKIKVPSNYVTREESADGIANYNRNITSGAITGSYQDWDGDFRTELVYTNNPAWVFYDIIVNNRYGLGAWVSELEVDKYSLYRIGRYCDELVPDGRGGFEPRFTMNLYLTKATDAYKVLKDMATVFRGILYSIDSKLVPIIDEPKSPIYTFTQGNVIEGRFSYESTGSKTRANQVIVSWNNPEADYKLEALLVEDKDNIIETGRIISQDAVALGTTSEGQALRFGRWKLWTAKNQKEIVSFQTSINAAFLGPGDIINVQDSNRYNIQYSGRISNEGILTASRIPLDRQITLNPGSTYQLSIIITEPGTFLTQESATIDSIEYTKGDLIQGEFTENEAANLLDDFGNSVLTSWKDYSRVEVRDVSTLAGIAYVIDVSEAFSSVPMRGGIWALRELTDSGLVASASLKQYKILSIAEEGKHLHSIVAVEHYNEKFDVVDRDFSSTLPDTIYTPPKATDIVPPPRNLFIVKNGESSVRARTVTIKWDAPSSSGLDSNYAYISGYEIQHPLFYPNPIIVGSGTLNYTFNNVFVGTYTIGVRTLNSRGNKSDLKKVTFKVGDAPDIEVGRGKGIAIGGTTNISSFITSDGYYKFEIPQYVVSPIAAPFTQFKNTSTDADTYIQSCIDIPAVDFDSISDPFERELAAHYLILDYSDLSDPLKLLKYNYTDTIGIPYWYDTGTGNANASSTFISNTGTVSVSGSDVSGSGTLFTTEYQEGDIIKFSSTQAGVVVNILNNTSLIIDREITGVSASTHSRQGLRLDPTYDCAIAQIKNDTIDGYSAITYIVIDPALAVPTKVADLRSNPPFINFDAYEVLASTYTNLILTAYAPGFTDPEFKITGSGFDNAEISQVAESVFSSGVDKVYTKTLDKVSTYVAGTLDFTVTVREKSDPTNISKQAIDTISIQLIKFSGQKIYYQETAPVSGMVEGDFWVRDSDNRYHRYNGSSWIEIPDAELAALAADIAIAQATADGKIVTFYQDEPPVSASSGDLWFDTNDNNAIYRYNGTSWVAARDDLIAQAINDAADAQATADGKVTTFVGTTAPIAEGIGDLWLDTDDNNRVYRWNGSSWVEYMPVPDISEITSLLSVSGSTVRAGVGNNYILESTSSSVTIKHNSASLSTIGTYGGPTLYTGLFITSAGIAMGYNRQSDGVWEDSIVLDASSGDISLLGNVYAPGGWVYAGGSQLSTSGYDAAIVAIPGDFFTGGFYGISDSSEAGYFQTRIGTAIYGHSTGSGGSGVTCRLTHASGGLSLWIDSGTSQFDTPVVMSNSLSAGSTTVSSLSTGTLAVTSTSTFTGLITANGGVSSIQLTSSGEVLGNTVVATSSGEALYIPNGRIGRPYSTTGTLSVYNTSTGALEGTFRYSFE